MKIKREFDSVAFFREVKEQKAKYLEGKSFKEQKEILKKMQTGEIKFYNTDRKVKRETARVRREMKDARL